MRTIFESGTRLFRQAIIGFYAGQTQNLFGRLQQNLFAGWPTTSADQYYPFYQEQTTAPTWLQWFQAQGKTYSTYQPPQNNGRDADMIASDLTNIVARLAPGQAGTAPGQVFVAVAQNLGNPQSVQLSIQTDCAHDELMLQGLQATRNAQSTSAASANGFLNIPVPNPATDEVRFGYQLPFNHMSGTLVLRESLQGQVVQHVALTKSSGEVPLSVRALRPGLYLASLLVEGQCIASVRLQIVR